VEADRFPEVEVEASLRWLLVGSAMLGRARRKLMKASEEVVEPTWGGKHLPIDAWHRDMVRWRLEEHNCKVAGWIHQVMGRTC